MLFRGIVKKINKLNNFFLKQYFFISSNYGSRNLITRNKRITKDYSRITSTTSYTIICFDS